MSLTARKPSISPTFAAIAVAAVGVLISFGGALYPRGGVIQGLALTAIISLLMFIYCKRGKGVPATPAGGEPPRGDLRMQDITARKLAEVRLQQSSERFAIAADSAGIGVWELDRSSGGLTWDDWMYRIHGISQTREVENYAFWAGALHPEDRRRVESEVAAAFRGPRDFSSEFRIVRPDGEVRYVKAASRAIRGADGSGVKITGVNFDVTEARLREIVARRETASLLRTVLDSASEVSLIATDANLMIKVFNAGAERMLGFTSADVVGKHTLTKIHDKSELESCREALSLRDGRPVDLREALVDPALMRLPQERHYVHKNGGRITVSLFTTEMRSDEGTLLGYVCVAHDVTQQNKDQKTLLDATVKADKANNAKSIFLANMSHEIRTPMNAVIGLSYLLTRTPLTAEQSSLLGKLQLAGNSLLSIITNILDLSKIEADELLVESTVFSLPDLLRDVANVMSVQADAKGIEFTMDAAGELPDALTGDPTRLRQILVNLLSNAIRFTNRGSVRFTITPRLNRETRTDLSFSVADTGIGIAPEAQQKLFAPFAQADPSIGRRYGGTGLGLSIVKRLSDLLGGSVELESAVGIGSTFTVVLPFVPASSGALQAAREVTEAHVHGALLGIRALIVDDSDINLEVAKRILELDGVHVSFAIDGHEAFERLRAEPDAFDIVLMDVQMPILGGCEATRRIRGELGLLDLPIIAVTAGALNSERQRAKDAGMSDFICKPFDGPSLARSILKHIRPANLRHNAVRHPAAAPTPAPDVPWPVILGIDTADARARWCGDTALFITMLARLFTEFDQIDFPVDSGDSDAMATYVRLIHKLRGGACMLGARSLFTIAGQVETACIDAAYDTAAELTAELTDEMQRLIENAQPALLAERKRNNPAVDRRRSSMSAAH